VPTPPGVEVHPTPIYEIVMMAPIIWVLWRIARGQRSGWYTFGWFLVLSAVERFFVEFWRRNPEWLLGLSQPQWVAFASAAVGIVLILAYRGRPAERAPERAAGRAAARRARRARA
jgi:phosphatidylglycerol:prolipoprotein diacylglycerol transferase